MPLLSCCCTPCLSLVHLEVTSQKVGAYCMADSRRISKYIMGKSCTSMLTGAAIQCPLWAIASLLLCTFRANFIGKLPQKIELKKLIPINSNNNKYIFSILAAENNVKFALQ